MLSYVLKDIQNTGFVRNVLLCEHIAFLYTSEIAKNKILSKFFHPHTGDHEALN